MLLGTCAAAAGGVDVDDAVDVGMDDGAADADDGGDVDDGVLVFPVVFLCTRVVVWVAFAVFVILQGV